MLILSVTIGATATRYPVVYSSSLPVTGIVFVLGLFIPVTVFEATVTFLV